MIKSKRTPNIVLFVACLLLSSLACESKYAAELRGRQTAEAEFQATMKAEQATQQAAAQTAEPLETEFVNPTSTPNCLLTYDYFGQQICLQEDTLFPETPMEGTITLVATNGSDWIWYYDSSDNQIGQLYKGLSFEYSKTDSSEEFIIQIRGWVPTKDLIFEGETTGITTCQSHRWGHVSEKLLCHTHLWSNSNTVLGTIPQNFEFEASSDVSTRTIKNQDGYSEQAEGIEISLVQLVRIKPENTDTQTSFQTK